MDFLELAAYHADKAEELLAEISDLYAPADITKATAAQAHATLAMHCFERAQRS